MRTVERPADQVDARRVGLWLNRNGWVNWSGLATLLADLPLTFASPVRRLLTPETGKS
jgi:hypothetical protein